MGNLEKLVTTSSNPIVDLAKALDKELAKSEKVKKSETVKKSENEK